MIVIREKDKLREIIRKVKGEKKIGFVPTMGYLHEGHLSLIRLARERCEFLVVSIYVNPTQFGPEEDYQEYPRDLARDLELLQREGVDLVFAPDNLYNPDHSTFVVEEELSQYLCGPFRPGHFRGVTTVVTKLFHLIEPDLAVFGAKDYQQAKIIERMVRDLDFDVELLIGPTIREGDGLAMSSRNEYLNPEERKRAIVLYRSLIRARELIEGGEKDPEVITDQMSKMIEREGGKIEYIEIVDPESLQPLKRIEGSALIALAVRIGKTRLIDNLLYRGQNGNR
ncbi:pantoate--beta-alanine ligase [candidate division WOR-3 bacterium]|uniref:Pantothenate synthetase n=1 Tax=candidate division WOR-3 bacterium TaxID=2052148 RepID=A0A660SHG8_UNCW3|nr:MAG: pantoate--beta-alanine ligase [candidate division WOR-3 bacterium]